MCLVSLDDIIVFTQDPASQSYPFEHIETLWQKSSIKKKFKKCFGFREEVEYIHQLTSQAFFPVSRQADGTRALRESLFTLTMTELRSFPGA